MSQAFYATLLRTCITYPDLEIGVNLPDTIEDAEDFGRYGNDMLLQKDNLNLPRGLSSDMNTPSG
jgi:hypothetical protein